MNINIGREATVTNSKMNNLRRLPKVDNHPSTFIQIPNKSTVLVLDGPVEVKHNGREIPFWIVRVLGVVPPADPKYIDAAGWMAEISETGVDILDGR